MCFLGYLGGADPDGLGLRVKFGKMRKLFRFDICLEHCMGDQTDPSIVRPAIRASDSDRSARATRYSSDSSHLQSLEFFQSNGGSSCSCSSSVHSEVLRFSLELSIRLSNSGPVAFLFTPLTRIRQSPSLRTHAADICACEPWLA